MSNVQTQLKNGTATTILNENDTTVVRYHHTDVVRFNQHTITLNSGGWETVTTKRRMNQVSQSFDLGYSVYQKNFNWFVDYNGETLKFVDGMELNR